MIQLFKSYSTLILCGVVIVSLASAVAFIYRAGGKNARLKNLEVENVQIQKAKRAREEYDACINARGLASCVPNTFERKD